MTLTESVTALTGVGSQIAERLQKLGIKQIQDLLFHLPLRYQDRTRLQPLATLKMHQEALVEGTVRHSQIKFARRRSLLCEIVNDTGSLTLRFFHFSNKQRQQLAPGVRVRCFGEVRKGKPSLEMVHPEYQIIADNKIVPVAAELTPIYPTTEGLHQRSFQKLIQQALACLTAKTLPELLPETARLDPIAHYDLAEALRFVHQPPPDVEVQLLLDKRHPTQRRLAYEELLAHYLSMRKIKAKAQQYAAPALDDAGDLQQQLTQQLPFALTQAQQRVIKEILLDIAQAIPMQRLLQGDVGSGKTVVAAMAILQAIASGYQAVMMAPTELLAEQHLRTLQTWLVPLGIQLGWCVGKQTAAARKQVLAELVAGKIQLVVGTHALFQDEVVFNKLGLVVIDEQHRFGVHQRLTLRDKGKQGDRVPHQLVMTATPIPRTLAMTAYADLDVSVIDQLPPGRTPVTTVVLPDSRRDEIIERIRAVSQQKRQIYWVCTLVEESEHLQCQTAEDTAQVLGDMLPELRIGLVHGRLKAADKDLLMQQFKAGEIDLLVATTVIEVGVDVPNASLMIIENAERLGLAQLHQLRGRVGRGSLASHCVLMYKPPLSDTGQARLSCLRDTNDGFVIAQRDLQLRGPGEVLGTRQTGLPQFRVADVQQDQDLITMMPQAAAQFLATTPAQSGALITRWFGNKMGFGQV